MQSVRACLTISNCTPGVGYTIRSLFTGNPTYIGTNNVSQKWECSFVYPDVQSIELVSPLFMEYIAYYRHLVLERDDTSNLECPQVSMSYIGDCVTNSAGMVNVGMV